mgnify:CR=1 FL=1
MEVGGLCYICLFDYTNRKEVIVMAMLKEYLIALWVLIARPKLWKEHGWYSNVSDILEDIRLMDVQSVDEFWRMEHYSRFSDFYKDVVGVRPRHINWKHCSIEEMNVELKEAEELYGHLYEEE